MKLQILATLFTLAATSHAHNAARHAQVAHKRQASSTTTSSSSGVVGTTSTAAAGASTTTVLTGLTASGVPALDSITSGMPSGAIPTFTGSFTPGATPPVSGAPVLPSAFAYNAADWPALDKRPDTSSPEVQEWLKELDGWNIPDLEPTTDGSCASDPAFAADAANRGWWSCGHYTRPTDIISCPDKFTWGVSFDDGPSDYTPKLLDYLDSKNISATFFVVGSRVVSRPQILIDEYMSGHEISVHTWSHPTLTSLTNVEIVAELGWTRKAIKDVLGITPVTMRPPYGDIDDRVRAISLAMGMVPIIWTSTPSLTFDTNDWKVAGGTVTGASSYETFEAILGNASTIDTGIIVLEHDLFEITVDLAVGYTINAALTHNPPFELKAIGACQGFPNTNLYLETTTNTTFPYTNTTSTGIDTNGDGQPDTTSTGQSKSSDNKTNAASLLMIPSALWALGLMALGLVMA